MEIASAEATVGSGRTQVGLSHSAPFSEVCSGKQTLLFHFSLTILL